MAELIEEAAFEISHELAPCHICGRTFLPKPLKKHAKVCEKTANKKRKTFDSLKQRIEGTELAIFHQPSYLRKHDNHETKQEPKPAKSKWKEKHEALVQAIRAAKGGDTSDPNSKQRTVGSIGSIGNEQCPTCERYFGPKAYDRHVEWCKEQKNRAPKSPAGLQIAKERLEARTKYRVPPLNKSKRSLTREKYASPAPNRNELSSKSNTSLERSTHSPARNMPSIASSGSSHNSATSLSERKLKVSNQNIQSSPKAKSPGVEKSKPKKKEEYNPFVVAEKQLQELLHCDDVKSQKSHKSSSPSPKTAPKLSPITKSSKTNTAAVPKTKINKHHSLDIEPPLEFLDKINALHDNFEIIENFINDNFVQTNNNTSNKTPSKLKSSKQSKLVDELNSNAMFKRKYSDDTNSIDPILINETDNLQIPDNLGTVVDDDDDDNYSPNYNNTTYNNDIDHYSIQYDRNISMLEPLILPKTETKMRRANSVQNNPTLDDAEFEALIASFDDVDERIFPTLKGFLQSSKTDDTNINSSNTTTTTITNSSSSSNNKSVKRSFDQKSSSAFCSSFSHDKTSQNSKKSTSLNPLKRSVNLPSPVVKARSMKNKQDIQDYLHVKSVDKTHNKMKHNPGHLDGLIPVDTNDPFEEFKRYEEMQHEMLLKQQQYEMDENEEQSQNQSPGISCADSAYGSLNRLSNNKIQMKLSPSTYPTESSQSSTTSDGSNKIKLNQRLSKFCHECGTKYPLDSAKFCVECGIKRLLL